MTSDDLCSVLTRSLQSIFGRASMSSSSDGSDPSLAGKLATVAELRAVADEVSRHIETVVTREDVLRPAREALAAAEKKKQLGNDGFRKGDFLAAYAEYMEAHKALDVASAEPTTAYAAEVLRLTVLANTAQCALKTGQPSAAANFCRDAVKLSVCVNDETLFKKILVRLAQAHEQMGEREKALAVVHEAQLRGVNADEFFALTEKHGVENVGALEPGVEARMFVMLAIRLSAGPENLERVRSILQTGAPARRPAGRGGLQHAVGRAAGAGRRGGQPRRRRGRRGVRPGARAAVPSRRRPQAAVREGRQDAPDVRVRQRARERRARSPERAGGGRAVRQRRDRRAGRRRVDRAARGVRGAQPKRRAGAIGPGRRRGGPLLLDKGGPARAERKVTTR